MSHRHITLSLFSIIVSFFIRSLEIPALRLVIMLVSWLNLFCYRESKWEGAREKEYGTQSAPLLYFVATTKPHVHRVVMDS